MGGQHNALICSAEPMSMSSLSGCLSRALSANATAMSPAVRGDIAAIIKAKAIP